MTFGVPSSRRPFPLANLWTIDPFRVRIVDALDDLVLEPIFGMRATGCEARHAVNNINGQTEPVDLIPNCQFQWRIDVALLPVSMNVKVLVVGSAIGELVNQRRIAMKVK